LSDSFDIKTIEALVKLQEIDNEVYRYVEQKDQLAKTLNELKVLVGKMQASVDEKRAKLVEVEKWYDEQLVLLKDYTDRINKIKHSLASVSKTKDYLMRQKELENLRRHKQSKEEEVEKVRDTIADFKDAIARDEERIAELSQDTEAEGGATWSQVRQLEETISRISVNREALLPLVPRNVMTRYEQIKRARNGLGIVPADNGECGGCHIRLRDQLFNTVLKRCSLEACPNCNRFLFVQLETAKDAENHDEQKGDASAA